MNVKDTFSFCVENFFKKSKNLRCNIRRGSLIVWSDDLEIYQQLIQLLKNRNIEVIHIHTVDELRYPIEHILDIKAILLDCPNIRTMPEYHCIIEHFCFENVDWIRCKRPDIPIIFYSSKRPCVLHLSKKYKFLTPILKGDIEKLTSVLGLDLHP